MNIKLHVLIIILITSIGCDNHVATTALSEKRTNNIGDESNDKGILKVDKKLYDSTVYHSGAASWQVIQNEPETLIYENHKVVAFTHFNKFIPDDSKTKSISIDSVELLELPSAKAANFLGQNGFTIMKGDNYNLKDFIILDDINHDGSMDIRIYNSLISKGNNILYDAYLRDGDTFIHSMDFSMRNLNFDSLTNTYSSRFIDDEEGMRFLINRYKLQGDSLKLVGVEQQTFLKAKNIYWNKKKDFITGEITEKEIKDERLYDVR